MIKVLLVDDNALFRDGIVQILHADGRFQVVGQASDGAEGIAAAGRLRPDLILMDLRMPGMGGVEAIRAIRADAPQVPIGVLTMFESAESVQSALQAGASGYVAKDATPDDFCEAASSLAQGTRQVIAIPNALATRTDGNHSSVLLARLTDREREVLRALSTGASTAEIARALGITTKTLRNHISATYHKLGIYDRAQAVILAVREGLVDVQSP
ncbi:MAG: response regulator transcription factor [Chloroflexi bacterium]|nr:MAG: response regulator transcription factor [Chloroflexota bacterium]